MYNDFETPDTAPEIKQGAGFTESPIDYYVEFKGGKSQPVGTSGKLGPTDLGVKFCYYQPSQIDGEKGVLEQLNSFTFYVLGIYSRFAGGIFNPDKPKESERFTSTLYRATTDNLYFRKDFVKSIRENPAYANYWTVGNYRQVRAFADEQSYRDGVGYKKVMIAYSPQMQSVVEIWVSRAIEYGLSDAIAKATNTARDSRRIGGLNDLSTQFWGFHFSGDFEGVQEVKGKECQPFDGKGEWRFAPLFRCGVIKTTSDMFDLLSEKQAEVDHYVDSQIEWANSIIGTPVIPATIPGKTEIREQQYMNPAISAPMPEMEPILGDDLPF